MGAVQGHTGGAAWSKHHVQRGRRPVHDEVPADLLLRCLVSPSTQSCTPVWLESGVASRAVLDVRGVAQVSVITRVLVQIF